MNSYTRRLLQGTVSISLLFLVVCLFTQFCIPAVGQEPETEVQFDSFSDLEEFVDIASFSETFDLAVDLHSKEDAGLVLYRKANSRPAVEWFYTALTGNREVSLAILEHADKNDIPLSLAFSLAYVESNFRPKAVNSNTNETIDRGLFQLNDRSFPKLTEEDFFDPATSAKYGMIHLRWCMDIGGNEATGLAMYNAGVSRVKANQTPKHTLAYVSKIQKYKSGVDSKFATEVATFYSNAPEMIAMGGASINRNY